MLRYLHIKNLALIDDLEVSFDEGFNVITGETGAGKSLLMQALGLAIGGRAAADLIRHEAQEASVEAVFAVDDDTMESEVLRLCEARGWSLGVAESLTGGFIGARIANVPGASRTFKGSLASYATEVKR